MPLILAIASIPVWAQGPAQPQGMDISGSWMSIAQEDGQDNLAGPYAVDYTGLPLNEEGRAKALSWAASVNSMIERQCIFWPPHYITMGPWSLQISADTDPTSGRIIAWKIGAWEDRAETVIYMDGRPHPSANARHTQGGFTNGVWEGNQLVATTTHFKAGVVRRNGAPSSDMETLTTNFIRHGDLLTVLIRIDDPIYMTEPLYRTKSFRLNVDTPPLAPHGPPCIPTFEGTPEDGSVPSILPGKNPSIDELTELYGIPREATLGGAATMYPEYRKKIKDQFVLPPKCVRNCGGPAARPAQPPAAPPPAASPPR